MEIGIIHNNYDKHTYPELRDERNVDNFFKKELKRIKDIRSDQGKRVVVYDVCDFKYWFDEAERIYKLSCNVEYKVID
jgi:hypothetical protein|tara:strand:- start:222 stop:455 length:234 start_codon:yes stop_codon:yes gene_type:complete